MRVPQWFDVDSPVVTGPNVDCNSAFMPPRVADAGTKIRSPSGSYTVGTRFYVTTAVKCVGGEICWKLNAAPETVTITLWTNAGVQLAQGEVTVSTTGVAVVTFGSPVALAPYTLHVIGASATNTNNYTHYNTSGTNITHPNTPFNAGGGLWFEHLGLYNSNPATFPAGTSAERYPVAPLFG